MKYSELIEKLAFNRVAHIMSKIPPAVTFTEEQLAIVSGYDSVQAGSDNFVMLVTLGFLRTIPTNNGFVFTITLDKNIRIQTLKIRIAASKLAILNPMLRQPELKAMQALLDMNIECLNYLQK